MERDTKMTTQKKLFITGLILWTIAISLSLFKSADADTFYLNWFKPTEREDNKPLLPEEIHAYELKINGKPVDKLIDGAAQEHTLDLPKPGKYLVELITIDTDGRTSKPPLAFPMMEVLAPVLPPKSPSTGTWKRKTP